MKPNIAQRTALRVFKHVLDVVFGGSSANTYQSSVDWDRGTTNPTGVMERPYIQVGPFQRVVSVIARDAASIPWEFFAVGSDGEPGDDPVPNHPVAQLFKRPNGHMTGNQLMIGMYISYFVFGEYFLWYPDVRIGTRGGLKSTENGNGNLFLLYPPAVKRKLNSDGTISYTMRNADTGMDDPIDGEVLTHGRRYNPYSHTNGLPLAASIIADLMGYHAAAVWNDKFFSEHNAVPSLVITPDQPGAMLNVDDRQGLLRTFLQGQGGGLRKVAMLPGGYDVKDFGMSQRDMDFAELRQFGRDEVLAAAGVPPLVAGYLTRPITYNASEQKQLYWESTISNFIAEQAAVINNDLLPKLGVTEQVFAKWEIVKALLENLVEKTEIADKWFGMGLSKRVINERLEMGWDPDLIPDYEEAYIRVSKQSNVVPVDMVEEVLRQPTAEATGNGNDDDEGSNGDSEGNGESKASVAGLLREHRRKIMWRNVANRSKDIESKFDGVIRSHMEGIRKEVLRNVNSTKGWLATSKDHGTVTKGKVLEKLSLVRKTIFDDVTALLFNVAGWKRKLQRSTGPLHREALRRGGELLLIDIGSDIDFELHDPNVTAKLAELQHKITRIDDTIETELRKSLVEGVTDGESPQQLAKRVNEVMHVSKTRSITIARTETGFAFGVGRNIAMTQAGIKKHEWLSARDDRVRDTEHVSHVAEDGKVVEIGTPFPGTKILHPLDPAGPPEQVINCRCTAIPVIEA